MFLRLKVNGPLGWDDTACGIATIFGVTQSCVTLAAVHEGLGHTQDNLSTEQLDLLFILFWIGNQFYIAAMACATLSISLLICRIAWARHHLVLGYSIAGAIESYRQSEAVRRRSLDDEEEGKERARATIQQTTEVEVYYEKAGPAGN
ncbi:uncharacterized protein MYCFIDRAFT_80708 [Pseudocercospora fijiensis CIRAD86]|uniref:Rhodopsin domain-containing protein n=1 Tax=Pseudocercospora fijiensis (strain CIRAD86) TaxID=383855 RepID=M3A1N3_PSEFD|nr:uncharacterized protein MYCFIDRAFT_80708 [Pseudocercospora fijiensis CIRAD86]EME78276.1 hypothetical protein MYCFIDRAFT_80708 [Pseudocercospora fijiensis CIRAD86]